MFWKMSLRCADRPVSSLFDSVSGLFFTILTEHFEENCNALDPTNDMLLVGNVLVGPKDSMNLNEHICTRY